MANTWTVRFYNKGDFRFVNDNTEEFSSLSSYDQSMISKLLNAEFDIEFPVEPKIGMNIQLSSFGNIATDSSEIMCYLDKFQNTFIERIVVYQKYSMLYLKIQANES